MISKAFQFRDFQISDLNSIEPIEPYMEIVEDWDKVKDNAIGITAVEDGVPIACGGVIVGEEARFWVRSSGAKPFALFRIIQEAKSILMDSLGDMVYSALILSGFGRGEKLARILGFRKTDKTVEYNNKTYYRYVL